MGGCFGENRNGAERTLLRRATDISVVTEMKLSEAHSDEETYISRQLFPKTRN